MEEPELLDGEAVAAAMLRHVAEAPPSLLVAMNGEAFAVPVPDSIPRGHHVVSRATHALDTVAQQNVREAMKMWEAVVADGRSDDIVTLTDGTPAHVTMYDVRPTHGVIFAIATPVDGALDPHVGATPDRGAIRPRVCRMRKDAWANIIDIDAAVEPMLGWRREDLIGHKQLDFVHPDDESVVVETWLALLALPGTPQRLRVRHRRRDGSYVWVEVINHNRLGDEHQDVTCDVIDISEQVEAEQALAEREQMLNALTEMLQELTESLPSGVAQFDRDGRLVYSNARLFALLGSSESTTWEELLDGVDSVARASLRDTILSACRDAAAAKEVEARVALADGAWTRVCQFVVRPLTGGSAGAVLAVTDITDTVERRAELERRATTDLMTQCYNRDATMSALADALARAEPGRGSAAVFVDLDGFKAVNDTLGHSAGDEMLRLVAERLREAVREGDLVGRVGGDEFLVVCPACATPQVAEEIAARLVSTVRQPAVIAGQPVVPGASVGAAWSDGTDGADELVRRADAAMYAAKQRSRATAPPPASERTDPLR